MAKKCELNCKAEGPPGPIWCTNCGHAPSCCTCDDNYDYKFKEPDDATNGAEADGEANLHAQWSDLGGEG